MRKRHYPQTNKTKNSTPILKSLFLTPNRLLLDKIFFLGNLIHHQHQPASSLDRARKTYLETFYSRIEDILDLGHHIRLLRRDTLHS